MRFEYTTGQYHGLYTKFDLMAFFTLHPQHQFLHLANAERPIDVMAGKGVPSSRGGSAGAEAPRKAPSAGRAGTGSTCCTGRRGPACRSGIQGEPGAHRLDVRPSGLPPRPWVPPLPRGTAQTLVHFHRRPPHLGRKWCCEALPTTHARPAHSILRALEGTSLHVGAKRRYITYRPTYGWVHNK